MPWPVTALYEIVPPGAELWVPGVDPLKYQQPARPVSGPDTGELLTLKLRYKEPAGEQSALIEAPLVDSGRAFQAAEPEFRFAAAVAAFGMVLRDSPNKGDADLGKVREWAKASAGDDKGGHRTEFLGLVDKARTFQGR
jgi:Ca-activated chloride channel family protein